MDPWTLGIALAGTGASLYGQSRARRAAQRAAAQNRRQNAWTQLMQAAGGQGVSSVADQSAEPTVDYGAALAQLGNTLAANTQAEELSQYRTRQLDLRQEANATSAQRADTAADVAQGNERYRLEHDAAMADQAEADRNLRERLGLANAMRPRGSSTSDLVQALLARDARNAGVGGASGSPRTPGGAAAGGSARQIYEEMMRRLFPELMGGGGAGGAGAGSLVPSYSPIN